MKPGLSFLNAIRSKKKEDDRVIKNARDNITFKRFRSDVSKISMKAKEKNEKYIDTFIYQLRNLNANASYEDKKRFIYMHLSEIYNVAKRLALTYDEADGDKLFSEWKKIQDYLQESHNNIITPNTIDWVYKNILISAKKKLKPITKITKEGIKEFNRKIEDQIKQARDIIKGKYLKKYIY